jgi:hypothetical protein
MVVGKRINNNSTWKLGDESIEEVNECKYLGYFVNRTLKSNFHICNFLKEKDKGGSKTQPCLTPYS